MAGIGELTIDPRASRPPGSASKVVGDLQILVHEVIDDQAERERLSKAIAKSDWDNVKIGGKIYAVPDLKQGYSGSFHMLWREDLRKKYNTPPVTDTASMEKYLDAIKQNEPSMYPVEEGGDSFLKVSKISPVSTA